MPIIILKSLQKSSWGLIFPACFFSFALTLSSCNDFDQHDQTKTTYDSTDVVHKEVYENLSSQEVIDFVDTWKNLYTTHTYDNYIKLYDPQNFVGIKRTFKGEKNVYDFSGWIANKKSEFSKYSPDVSVEEVKVKYLNNNGRSKVSFIQTWISYNTNYADRGEKVMILKKVNGEIVIEKEELLYSQPVYDVFQGT